MALVEMVDKVLIVWADAGSTNGGSGGNGTSALGIEHEETNVNSKWWKDIMWIWWRWWWGWCSPS
ncbi:MAG: hypothetical protein CM15mV26_1200 [uncultured marine virus]|nr:MAG: hypothetical protein CM15mV26_1200 [uncultured marine virus]